MSEVTNVPSALSMFAKTDLNGGIFGADSARNESESRRFNADLEFGTFAEVGASGMIAPSATTTELLGVVMVTNSSSQAQKALFKQSSGSVGAIGKGGYIVCLMDATNKPGVDQALSINTNVGKVGYVTGLTAGGVLNVAKAVGKVVQVFDTHCLVELSGDNVIACTYAA